MSFRIMHKIDYFSTYVKLYPFQYSVLAKFNSKKMHLLLWVKILLSFETKSGSFSSLYKVCQVPLKENIPWTVYKEDYLPAFYICNCILASIVHIPIFISTKGTCFSYWSLISNLGFFSYHLHLSTYNKSLIVLDQYWRWWQSKSNHAWIWVMEPAHNSVFFFLAFDF